MEKKVVMHKIIFLICAIRAKSQVMLTPRIPWFNLSCTVIRKHPFGCNLFLTNSLLNVFSQLILFVNNTKSIEDWVMNSSEIKLNKVLNLERKSHGMERPKFDRCWETKSKKSNLYKTIVKVWSYHTFIYNLGELPQT